MRTAEQRILVISIAFVTIDDFVKGYFVSNHCPHVHIICDGNDTSLHYIQDSLSIYFEGLTCLSRDLYSNRPEAADYSWHCVNACDYAFVLIGDSYGTLTQTGVSQLHVSYLNAKTKRKPLVVFIKKNNTPSPRLADFINTLKKDGNTIVYFEDNETLTELIKKAHTQLSQEQQAHIAPNTPTLSDTIIAPMPTKRADNIPPNLQDEILLAGSAHAFEGGTLIEVAFSDSITSQALLSTLSSQPAFGTRGLWQALNALTSAQAIEFIKSTRPNAHAISRCQINKTDVLWVQQLLLDTHWISKGVTTTGKDIWRITPLVKTLLQTHATHSVHAQRN